jgi:hypothetical protein
MLLTSPGLVQSLDCIPLCIYVLSTNKIYFIFYMTFEKFFIIITIIIIIIIIICKCFQLDCKFLGPKGLDHLSPSSAK